MAGIYSVTTIKMSIKLKKIAWSALNRLRLDSHVQLSLKSALKEKGWFTSFHTKQSVDAANQPIPWYTYNFISFLTPRMENRFKVFEFGCGNSTRWYANRVSEILAVENDQIWYEKIKDTLPMNAHVVFQPLGEDYIQAAVQSGKKFDIIVVDGRKRVKCTKASIEALTDEGVLILDNSEREWYQDAKRFMEANNFRRLDFWGMAPIVAIETCTSVFYRDNNCLGI